MSETITPDPVQSDDTGVAGEPDGTTNNEPKEKTYTQADIDEAVKRRQAALAKADKEREAREKLQSQFEDLQKQLKAITDQKRAEEEDRAVKTGDSEKLRKSLEEQKAELLREIEEREAKAAEILAKAEAKEREAKQKTFKGEVYKAIMKHSDTPEPIYLMIKDRLELVDEDADDPKLRVRDELEEVDSFVLKFMEENGLAPLIRNGRKSGSGTPQQPNGDAGKSRPFSLMELSKQPDKGASYFAQNPDVAEEFLRQAKVK